MVKIIIVFMIIIIVLAVLIALAVAFRTRNGVKDFDKKYYDSQGHHRYYERSLIEKEEFRENNPSVKGVRTLKRLLFGRERPRK